MPSCDEIRARMTLYVDQEGTPMERRRIGEHLEGCPDCQRAADEEGAGRAILRQRADAVRAPAPTGLVARCRPVARRVAPGRSRFAWLPVPIWAAAAAVFVLATGTLVVAGRTTTVFAAELALDHLKCFALFENASRTPDPESLSRQLGQAYGWRLKVPGDARALELRLVGGRRCFSTDGRVAHILYRHGGRPLSLFFVPGGEARAAATIDTLGHEVIMWPHGGMTVVVMAREPREQLARVADYFKRAVE